MAMAKSVYNAFVNKRLLGAQASMTTSDLSGTKLHHYQLETLLKQRPLTALYLANDESQKKPMLIELITGDHTDESHGRFHRRMDTLSQIDHPGIAPILEVATTLDATNADKTTYAVIEHTSGRTLAEAIADPTFQPDTIAALTLVRQIAAILQAVHPVGIFHHDLRPENILLTGDDQTPCFIDLGVPITQQPVSKATLQHMKTLDYASPEQQSGKPLTGTSNVFSLGVILYELLAGHPPRLPSSQWDIFDRDHLPQEVPLPDVRPDLTAVTHIVVRQSLWRKERDRYQTIDALIVGLDEAITAETRAQQEPIRTFPFSRQQMIYGAIALIAVALIITAIVLNQ